MKEEEIKKSLKPFNFNQITNEVPELNKINCRIDAISFEQPIDSSDINEIHGKKLVIIFMKITKNMMDL